MAKDIKTTNQDFEQILTLITEARNRVYSKANSELVLLYFNVGKVVSEKVNAGKWGDNTVQELADFIQSKMTNLSGFNRRGLPNLRYLNIGWPLKKWPQCGQNHKMLRINLINLCPHC